MGNWRQPSTNSPFTTWTNESFREGSGKRPLPPCPLPLPLPLPPLMDDWRSCGRDGG